MLRQYKHALTFLAKYVVLYLALNSLYAWYVESYKPDADPITVAVTKHSAFVLSIFDPAVGYHVVPGTANVPITRNAVTIIEVFEGCNSINVVIVFVSFIIAFRGPGKLLLQFFLIGVSLIYMMNLMRIIALYVVALKFPEALYFFHKFLFTGLLYAVVFALWYWWTIKVKKWKVETV
ncbi:MAG TPA: exosortase family protein XrtF [Chryseosolibacter sp.]